MRQAGSARPRAARQAQSGRMEGCEKGRKRRRGAAAAKDRRYKDAIASMPTEWHELCVSGDPSVTVHIARRQPGCANMSSRNGACPVSQSADLTGLDIWAPVTRQVIAWLQTVATAEGSVRNGRIEGILEIGAGLGAAGLLSAQLLRPKRLILTVR